MKTKVDPEVCIGCGLCPSVAPDIYEMGDDDKAHVVVEEVPDDSKSLAQEAADTCPVSAISID